MSNGRLEKLAELVVRVGANVQPEQDVHVSGLVEHAPIARVVAERAYAAGARRVVVHYDDRQVRRSAVTHAPLEALSSFYRYEMERLQELRERRAAVIVLTGDPDPHLFDGMDPERVAAHSPELTTASFTALESGDISWTVVPAPNPGWATQVFGSPDPEPLWDAVAIALRLDEPDPVLAWRDHLATLRSRRDALQTLDLDAVRLRASGTDLTVGLIAGSRWITGTTATNDGIQFVPNLPTEEVFTSPDLRRADGTVRITAPLVFPRGGRVSGLRLRLEGGRIVEVEAQEGVELVQAELQHDQAAHLGEVALVDRDSAVARAKVLFHNTVFDENAGCHIAWGQGFALALPGAESLQPEARLAAGLNVSAVHTDVVLGAPDLAVDGIGRNGEVTPILRENRWVLA